MATETVAARDYRDALHVPPNGNKVMFMAMSIALRFARATPSAEQIQRAFGMSQSNAYRWRAAMKAAKGEG